jgi:hypothetical protein
MKRTSIAMLLVFAMASTGCNRGKDEVLPDGTKLFGHIRLKDGMEKAVRLESPDGTKQFDVTWHSDGSKSVVRATFPDGTEKLNVQITKVIGCDAWNYREDSQGNKRADKLVCSRYSEEGVIWHPDGGFHADVSRFPDGQVDYNLDEPKGGELHIERSTHSDGVVMSDITSNFVRQKVAQMTDADGTKHFGVVFKCEEGKCAFESQERLEESAARVARKWASISQADRVSMAGDLKGYLEMQLILAGRTNNRVSVFASLNNLYVGLNVMSDESARDHICEWEEKKESSKFDQRAFGDVIFRTDSGDYTVPLPVSCPKQVKY